MFVDNFDVSDLGLDGRNLQLWRQRFLGCLVVDLLNLVFILLCHFVYVLFYFFTQGQAFVLERHRVRVLKGLHHFNEFTAQHLARLLVQLDLLLGFGFVLVETKVNQEVEALMPI